MFATAIGRVLKPAGLAVMILALPLASRAEAAPDPGQKGPYQVGFTSFVLTDMSRPGDGGLFTHRPIPVYVWYPVDSETITDSTPEAVYPLDPLYRTGMLSKSSDWEKYAIDAAYQEAPPSQDRPFPLIMFSPGWGAHAWFQIWVGTRMASHGFVVAVPYHFGDRRWPWEPFHHIALALWNRPRDLSFALTDLLAKNATAGHLLQGLVRPDRVAASGHSLGGYAAMTLAGGDDSVCDSVMDDPMGPPPPETCSPSFPDPRIKAIVPLDGSNQYLKFQELARVAVPAMGIGEEWTMLAATLPPPGESWQARQHAAFSSQPGYRVDVFNTVHRSFPNFCEAVRVLDDLGFWIGPPPATLLALFCTPYTPTTEVHRLVGKYMVAFLKTHLLGETGYETILTPGWSLTRGPLIEFFVTEKRNANAIDEEWPGDFVYFMHQPGSDQARSPKNPGAKLPVEHLSMDGDV